MRAFVMSLLLVLALVSAADSAPPDPGELDWKTELVTGNVQVMLAQNPAGPDWHRAEVAVCGDLENVAAYIADTDNFMDWVAYAEAVELLESGPERTLYYLKSSAPWPLRSRDMIYELRPRFDQEGTLHITMRGMPDALPPRAGAVRMDSVTGDWVFTVDGSEITIELTLQIDPGRVAEYFANRRIASTVALTLQSLAEKFPCSTRLAVPD